MKQFLGLLLTLFVLIGIFSPSVASKTFPTPEPKITPVNSFELFWPIAAGRVEGDILYPLKLLKENIREALIFSNFIKADYNIKIAEKRTVEAEKLIISVKNFDLAAKTLDRAQLKRERILILVEKAAREGEYVVDLKNAFKESLRKQRTLLFYISTQLEGEQRDLLNENIKQIDSILEKLR